MVKKGNITIIEMLIVVVVVGIVIAAIAPHLK